MIAVIFEVWIEQEQKDEYLAIAAKLKTELSNIDGFISIERFQSLSAPDKLLSLSFWRDEKALSQWRNLQMHREAQSRGAKSIFKDYQIRVGAIVRDYGMFNREESPEDSRSSLGF